MSQDGGVQLQAVVCLICGMLAEEGKAACQECKGTIEVPADEPGEGS